MSINRVNISGNLTRDPEMRQTQGGTSVLTFGVAVNDRRRNPQTGEWEDAPNFIDCAVFGNRADAIQKWLAKGSKVAIEGKLRWSQWEAKDGAKRSKIEVIVDEIEFLSRQAQPGNGAAVTQQPTYAAPQPQPQPSYATPPQGGYQQAPQQTYATGGYMSQPVIAQPQSAPQPNYAAPPQPQAPTQQQLTGMPQPISDVYDEDIPF